MNYSREIKKEKRFIKRCLFNQNKIYKQIDIEAKLHPESKCIIKKYEQCNCFELLLINSKQKLTLLKKLIEQ